MDKAFLLTSLQGDEKKFAGFMDALGVYEESRRNDVKVARVKTATRGSVRSVASSKLRITEKLGIFWPKALWFSLV
jgi:hypothetical protein